MIHAVPIIGQNIVRSWRFLKIWYEIPPKFINNILDSSLIWNHEYSHNAAKGISGVKYQMQLWFLSVLAMFKCIQTNSVSFKFIILSRFQIYIRRNVNIYDYMNISEFKSCDHHEIMRRLSSIFNSQKIGSIGLNVNQSPTIT